MFFDDLKKLEDLREDEKKYDSLISVLNVIPSYIWLVNDRYEIMGANQKGEWAFAATNEKSFGLPYENLPYKGSALAEESRISDRKAFKSKSMAKSFSYLYCGEEDTLIAFSAVRQPIFNGNKEVIGLLGQCADISENFFPYAAQFMKYSAKYYSKKVDQFYFDLDDHYDDLNLSPRQSELFFFLLRGKTSKEISELMNVSMRTVESYIEEIKSRLQCDTKSQLIEKGINSGYFGILPEIFFKKFFKR